MICGCAAVRKNRLNASRVLGVLRRAVKANRRPVIAADVARERYEPLIEMLAGQLAMETMGPPPRDRLSA